MASVHCSVIMTGSQFIVRVRLDIVPMFGPEDISLGRLVVLILGFIELRLLAWVFIPSCRGDRLAGIQPAVARGESGVDISVVVHSGRPSFAA